MVKSDAASVDKGWAWMVLAGAVLWNCTVSGTLKSFGILYVEFMDIFDTQPAETGMVGFVFCLMMLLLAPVAGWLSDHVSCRRVMMVGSLVAGAGVFLTGFAPDLNVVVITYGIIAGGAVGVMDGPVFSTLNKYFVEKRGLANSLAFVGSGIGCLIIPMILRLAINMYTVKGTMFILSGIWLHACVIGALFRPIRFTGPEIAIKATNEEQVTCKQPMESECDINYTDKTQSNEILSEYLIPSNDNSNELCSNEEIKSHIKNSAVEDLDKSQNSMENRHFKARKQRGPIWLAFTGEVKDYIKFLCNAQMLRTSFAIFFGSFAYFNQMFLFPPLAKELGLSEFEGAILIGIPGITEICSRIPLGLLSDRKFINKPVLVACASIICCVLAQVVSFTASSGILPVYAGMLGVFGGTTVPLAMPMLADCVHPTRIGSAAGLFLLAMSSAFALGPPILGLVCEVLGSYMHSFRVCVLVYIPAVVLLLWSAVSALVARKRDTSIT